MSRRTGFARSGTRSISLAITLGLASSIASPLVGCDATDPIARTPHVEEGPVTPIPQSEFCPTLALEACAVMRPCCEASPYAFDEAKCRVSVRALCEARKVQAIGSSYEYDPRQGARCVRGVASFVRDCRRVLPTEELDAFWTDAACRHVWHAEIPVGQACGSGYDYDCTAEVGRAIVCSNVHICQPVELRAAGDTCNTYVDPVCQTGECRCAPGLACMSTLYESRCSAYPHQLGAPCAESIAQLGPVSAECGRDRWCDASGVCAELPGLGERCAWNLEVDLCRGGLRCDLDAERTCVVGKGLGAVCNADGECASATCRKHLCVPDEAGIATPSMCDGALFTDLEPVHGFLSVPSYDRGS